MHAFYKSIATADCLDNSQGSPRVRKYVCFMDAVSSSAPDSAGVGQGAADPDVLDALKSVDDPELGINIVDLGLVVSVERTDDRIAVGLTVTSPFCPGGEQMIADSTEVLLSRFPGVEVDVQLVRDVFWTPDRMSDAVRGRFG
jgi:metal-sulfur cluster biosynthetic enzyme